MDAPDEDGRVLARGSARSVNQIDLYELVKSQAHMLKGFGGHPFAAGMSLPAEDLPMFRTGINQQMRQKMGALRGGPRLKVDLTVTVADLGQDLFRQISLLEPCGMGNPVPKLLVKNCWFEDKWHQKLKDRKGGKVGYIKTTFQICDGSEEGDAKFPGLWWGHYKEDLPPGIWDTVVELDYNSYSSRYEVRLIDIHPAAGQSVESGRSEVGQSQKGWLLDWRIAELEDAELMDAETEAERSETDLVVQDCPAQWEVLQLWRHQAEQTRQPVALAYASPEEIDPIYKWRLLLGVAKYASKLGEAVTLERLGERLELGDRTLLLGLAALESAGFMVKRSAIDVRIKYVVDSQAAEEQARLLEGHSRSLAQFLAAVQEENFRRQYFYRAPVSTLQAAVGRE